MNSQHQLIATREDLMTFFRDQNMVNLLSKEDKIEIASQILADDSSVTNRLLQKLFGDKSVSFQQMLQQKNSLPVF